VWTAVLYDADNDGFPYIKRFLMEASKRKQNFLGENAESKLIILTDVVYPLIRVTFGGNDSYREPMEIDAEQFISVKGFKAKGKRISTWEIADIEELEPQRFPEETEPSENSEPLQLNLFGDED
jgi:topoisomerase-4 subunit A